MIEEMKLTAPCPKCEKSITITVKKLANEETIICGACGERIKLEDSDGQAKKALDSGNDFLNTLKGLGK